MTLTTTDERRDCIQFSILIVEVKQFVAGITLPHPHFDVKLVLNPLNTAHLPINLLD